MTNTNPFFTELDWALRGKECIVVSNSGTVFRGTVNRLDHSRGSVLLHDASIEQSGDAGTLRAAEIGSVFVRNVQSAMVAHDNKSGVKNIVFPRVDDIQPHKEYIASFAEVELVDDHMRSAYRNQFTGSFPVVRKVTRTVADGPGESIGEAVEQFELINGHKRIAACRAVGLQRHPCELIECTDEQASELVALAHREAAFDADGGDG